MRIKSIEPIAVSLPMLKPVIMAGEEVRRANNVLVRIQSENGFVGWGEVASAPLMTGETLESIVAAVNYLSPSLCGHDAADIAGAHRTMNARMYGNPGAKAGIDIALHDLCGRAWGKPVHALLGQKKRDRMPLLGVIGGGDLDGDLRDAVKKKNSGLTAYKIKVGVDTPEKDAARTRAICGLLGAGVLISADANQGYTREQALAYIRAVEGSGLDFLEQPVAADDLDGMAAAAMGTQIAIGADEGIHSIYDIRRHHERGAARGVSLKAIKLGGLRSLTDAARLCDQLGMSVNISCKTGESSLACAAALQVASVIPEISWALTLTHTGLAEDVTATPLPAANGHAEILEKPGLGIEVDEDRVDRYRVPIAARGMDC
ncbi:MAG TPA: enolase C-terminal domain-like protein [Pseudolabrys sp.]|nr:enolase C-terminal domain-like protein [Pseudolabrys sp.]